jgi:hypothetical protein
MLVHVPLKPVRTQFVQPLNSETKVIMDTLAVPPLQGRATDFHVCKQSPLQYGQHQYLFPVIMGNESGRPLRQIHTPQKPTRASYVYSRTEIVTQKCANGKVIGFLPQTSLVISIKQIYIKPTHSN